MKKHRSLALLTGLSLLLAACNGGQPGTTSGETIELTAASPISGGKVNLQLNDTVALTAIVKDANGSVITGKKVSWTATDSEGTQVTSVDGNGVVTANHFGTSTITASVDGVRQTVQVRTYGLEAFAGVRDSQYDTAMYFRYRTSTGALPASQKMTITISGPAGWNGGQPVVIQKDSYFFKTDGSGSHWFEFDVVPPNRTAIKPVVGQYKVTFDIDGQRWTSTPSITSLGNSSRQPTNITTTVNSSTSVTATWDDTVPNGSYDAEVVDAIANKAFYPPDYINQPTTVLDQAQNAVQLVAGTNYFVRVHAFSLDITAPVTTVLSGQFDVTQGTSLYFRP